MQDGRSIYQLDTVIAYDPINSVLESGVTPDTQPHTLTGLPNKAERGGAKLNSTADESESDERSGKPLKEAIDRFSKRAPAFRLAVAEDP